MNRFSVTRAELASPIDPQCAAIIAGQIAARGQPPLRLEHFHTPRVPIAIQMVAARQYPQTKDDVTRGFMAAMEIFEAQEAARLLSQTTGAVAGAAH